MVFPPGFVCGLRHNQPRPLAIYHPQTATILLNHAEAQDSGDQNPEDRRNM